MAGVQPEAFEEASLSSSDTAVVVFRLLPFRVERHPDAKEEGASRWRVVDTESETNSFKVISLLHQSLRQDAPDGRPPCNVKFVGDPGVRVSDPEDRKQITEALAPYSCIPVFVDAEMARQHLDFCYSFLWPVMHNVKVFDSDEHDFEEAEWKSYQALNRAYAEAIDASASPQALVWVHDYYLMLVPRYLALRRGEATVGFFLHCAFPSSEVLRCMPPREEILQSLLSCKVVAFQVFSYARHFLSCCHYLLSTTHSFQAGGILQIEHDGRSIVVRADHMVLPYSRFVTRVESSEVKERAARIRQKFGSRKLFASIDRDEPFAGLVLKLRAFQKFLADCPQHQHKAALLQHVLVDGEQAAKSELLIELRKMAEETNRTFGSAKDPVISIEEGILSVDERLALLKAADILLDTSINDGLNLYPSMFYCAHTNDKKGVAIISEFTGSSSFLTGAMKVNPWHAQMVMDAMHKAVTMDSGELEKNFQRDHSYVSTQTLSHWMNENLVELKKAQLSVSLSAPVRGLDAGLNMLMMTSGFRHLNSEAVLRDYRKAKVRAIFLDNEGTLAPDRRWVRRPYGSPNLLGSVGQPPDPLVLDDLRSLALDRGNVVVVISGRDTGFLDRWFGDVSGLGLCAEYGFYYVSPTKLLKEKTADRWQCMSKTSQEDDDWKELSFELMKLYVKRVQGSIIQNKGSAITWNYREVGDHSIAKETARELVRFLDPNNTEGLLHGYSVTIVSGKGYVEVKRKDIDKGRSVARVLQDITEKMGPIDFVLCMGDDRSDEDMFDVVNQLAQHGSDRAGRASPALRSVDSPRSGRSVASGDLFSPGLPPSDGADDVLVTAKSFPRTEALDALRKRRLSSQTIEDYKDAEVMGKTQFYTVTVGRKPSRAGYFVKDCGEVSELLHKLAQSTIQTKFNRISSMPIIPAGQDSMAGDD